MVLLVFGLLLGAGPAMAIDTGDITIVSLKGDVHVTMLGAERPVHVGSILELPATLRTGRDGAVGLRQGATSVDIGPDTQLEFPALAVAGGPIDRIVQPRGNAFYSVGKRPGRKLRVETPLLVGVVKGTQFNVAVQENSATFSLFEGLLEIRAADESSVVDIRAGEIASRHPGDAAIGVLKMDAKAAPLPPRAPAGATNNQGGDKPQPVVLRGPVAGDAQDPQLPQLSAERPLSTAPAIGAGRTPVASAPVTTAPVAVPAANVPVAIEAPAVSVPVTVQAPAASVPVTASVPAVSVPVTVAVPAASVPVTVSVPAVSVPVAEVPATNVSLGATVTVPAATVEVPAASVAVPAVVPSAEVSTSVAVSAPAASVDVAVSAGGVDLAASVDLANGNGNANSGPGNNNGNAGEGNNGNGKGNAGTGSLNSGSTYDDTVEAVLNGTLKKPGKK